MTTTVMIATQGNKEVSIETPTGRAVLPPGRWFSLTIHGDQALTIKETGEFVDPGPGVRFEDAPKIEQTEVATAAEAQRSQEIATLKGTLQTLLLRVKYKIPFELVPEVEEYGDALLLGLKNLR